MTTTTLEKIESLSIVTQALEQAHEIIKQETGAPRATILVTRALKGARAHYTHYTPWESEGTQFNEIALNAEIFSEGAGSVLGSLLHEVAHSMNHAEGVKDCSSNQYHNKNFKTRAESLGLETIEIQGKGYARTKLTSEGANRWNLALAVIEESLKITALGVGQGKPKGRNTNLASAQCPCGKKIRASRGVLDSGVRCDDCGDLFF